MKSLQEWCEENNRQDLLDQWHPTKNGNLMPNDVSYGSHTNVWWLMPYDDLKTGKHFDFEWQSEICSRSIGNRGCPYLFGHQSLFGFNDLATKSPKLAAEWNYEKNAGLIDGDGFDISTPDKIHYQSGKKVWWKLPYTDPENGHSFIFEWEATVYSRVAGTNCPYLCGRLVYPGFNDLATKSSKLAAEWNYEKKR